MSEDAMITFNKEIGTLRGLLESTQLELDSLEGRYSLLNDSCQQLREALIELKRSAEDDLEQVIALERADKKGGSAPKRQKKAAKSATAATPKTKKTPKAPSNNKEAAASAPEDKGPPAADVEAIPPRIKTRRPGPVTRADDARMRQVREIATKIGANGKPFRHKDIVREIEKHEQLSMMAKDLVYSLLVKLAEQSVIKKARRGYWNLV